MRVFRRQLLPQVLLSPKSRSSSDSALNFGDKRPRFPRIQISRDMPLRVNASEARRLQFAAAEVEFQMPDTGNKIRTAHLRLLLNAEKAGQKSQLSPFPWNGNGLR